MKKLILALAMASWSMGAVAEEIDLIELGYQFMESSDIWCEYIPDINEIKYGNVTVYTIVCENNDHTNIYEYVPQQFVQVYHLEY